MTGGELFLGVQDGESVKIEGRMLGDIPALASRVSEAGMHADVAEAARDAALIQSGVYPDEPTGRAAVADGQAFKVQGDGAAVAAYEYRRMNASSSTLIATYPAKGYIDGLGMEVSSDYRQTSGDDFGQLVQSVLDEGGNLSHGVNADGDLIAPRMRGLSVALRELLHEAGAVDTYDHQFAIVDEGDNVALGVVDGKLRGFFDALKATTSTVEGDSYNYSLAIVDESDNVLFGVLHSGSVVGAFNLGSLADTQADLLARADQKNKAFTAAVMSRDVQTVQRPTCKYNVKFVYGQSLGQGDETWPALSRANRYGNLMLGGNVMGSVDGAVYTPFGSATLQPLAAQTVNGATQYDAAGEAALAPGNGSRGEPVNHGWVNGAKFLLNQRFLMDNDPSRLFVSVNIAKSGVTIGQLAKGHTEGPTEYYGKYTTALSLLATARGSDAWCVDGIAFMQGEYDYSTAQGSLNSTYAAYKAKLTQLCADMQADAKTATGQVLPPAFLTYQTGAAYTRDVDGDGVEGLHVGMAQLDFAIASKAAWMVGPVYPYTDKGGHLDSNGSRWFGHQIAKVWNRVAVEGKGWQPVRPVKLWKGDARTIFIGYHVPHPPLAFDSPYVVSAAADYAAKGFRVKDTTGGVAITNVEIVADTIIKITLGRDLTGADADIKVWYAGQTSHNGNGNVRDSDPSVAIDNYVYEPERGMYAAANIPALVDQPYPLHNWSVAFYYSLTYSEI
ncbi:hypothetical protein [Cupriavidus oxalaticus]|uniref:Sialate O-acetylesterase domain-containing protein n=1 Tax=Cupriavidus oxalaticus TaxID=96344 RepID=A0A4V1BZQ7_9BURK|nr:hypothetical protein [Cupriavidus oxalaticus]QBY56162.1 hypothetical protein E0W60_34465 [Cupriavidus oxalaticus]